MITVPRESNEPLVPRLVDRLGAAITPATVDSIEFAITEKNIARDEIPTDAWQASTTFHGSAALAIGPGTSNDWADVSRFPHTFILWTRIAADGFSPVLEVDAFTVS
jgi:hypothetical protein